MNNRIFVKMLVYQPTNHVVWMMSVPAGMDSFVHYIPNIDRTLDYKIYAGPGPSQFNIHECFQNYTLIKEDGPGAFHTGLLASQHMAAVKLARAKCTAAQIAWNILKHQIEKHNSTTSPWSNLDVDSNIMLEPLKRHYNLNDTDAKKLANFKQQEMSLVSRKINAAQLDAELHIMQAKSIEELLERFELIKAYSMINPEFNLRALSVNFTCT